MTVMETEIASETVQKVREFEHLLAELRQKTEDDICLLSTARNNVYADIETIVQLSQTLLSLGGGEKPT